MGECGCYGNVTFQRIIEIGNEPALLQVYLGCDYCDAPVTADIHTKNSPDFRLFKESGRLDNIKKYECIDGFYSIPIFSARSFKDVLKKYFKDIEKEFIKDNTLTMEDYIEDGMDNSDFLMILSEAIQKTHSEIPSI